MATIKYDDDDDDDDGNCCCYCCCRGCRSRFSTSAATALLRRVPFDVLYFQVGRLVIKSQVVLALQYVIAGIHTIHYAPMWLTSAYVGTRLT